MNELINKGKKAKEVSFILSNLLSPIPDTFFKSSITLNFPFCFL